MRVLHVGLMVNPSLNVGLSKAFRDVCEKYVEVPITPDIRRDLMRINDVFDIVFVQIQSEKIGGMNTNILLNEAMERFRSQGAFIINWTGDIRSRVPEWMYGFTADLTCFSNYRDVNEFNNPRHKADFLQIGIDPENFNWDISSLPDANVIPQGFKYPEIVFFANHAGHFPLSTYRHQVVTTLQRRYGDRFTVIGNGYPGAKLSLNASADDPARMQKAECLIYNRAKVAISVSHFSADGYYSDRLLRAMGSGVAVLSHHYPGIEKNWKVGVELEVFNNIDELIKKTEYLLNNPVKCEDIMINGYHAVHKQHEYRHMVRDIFELHKKHKNDHTQRI